MIRHFKWTGKASNTITALRRVAGFRKFQSVARSTVDLRELTRNTAYYLNVTEEALSNRVAEELRLPFVVEFDPMDPARLENPDNLKRFEQAGATLLLKNGQILGIACVDPDLLHRALPESQGFNIFIAPWTQIQKALKRSFEMQSSQGELSESEIDQLITDLLALLAKFKTRRMFIHFESELASYSFCTADGQQGQGKIAPRAVRYLQARLEFARVGASLLRTSKSALNLDVQCINSQPLCYLIEIKEQLKALEAPSEPATGPHLTPNAIQEKRSASPPIKQHLKDLVLFIDDDPVFASVLDRHLKHQGFHTVHKSSAKEALEALEQKEIIPFAVVCDFHMPIMNGPEFVSTLRSSAAFSELPIIMLTSDIDVEAQLQAIARGADLFLNKTDNPKILSAHLRRLYTRQLERQEAA